MELPYCYEHSSGIASFNVVGFSEVISIDQDQYEKIVDLILAMSAIDVAEFDGEKKKFLLEKYANEKYRKSLDSFRNQIAIYLHEFYHFVQNVSTTFGLLCHYAVNCQSGIISCLFTSMRESFKVESAYVIPIPFFEKYKQFLHDPAAHREVQLAKLLYESTDKIMFSLLGAKQMELSQVDLALPQFFFAICEHKEIAQTGRDFKKPWFSGLSSDNASPIRYAEQLKEKVLFGARDLIEFSANMYSINRSARGNYSFVANNWVDSMLTDPVYASTAHILIDNLKTMEFDSLAGLAATSALIELALMIPIGPSFTHFFKPHMSWEDIHPGWRFIKAIEAANKLPPIKSKKYDDDLKVEVRKFTDGICTLLKWPSLQELYDNGKKFKGLNDYIIYNYFAQFCERKLNDPLAGSFFDRNELMFRSLPPVQFHLDGSFRINPEDPRSWKMLFLRNQWYIYRDILMSHKISNPPPGSEDVLHKSYGFAFAINMLFGEPIDSDFHQTVQINASNS